MEKALNKKRFRIFLLWLILALLLGILAYTAWQITTDLVGIKRSGVLHMRRRLFAPSLPLGRGQVGQIQNWMTFRYVNTVFRLPSAFLQTQLNIADKHYPNITIDTLAKQQSRTSSAELLLVQQKIQNYFKAQPSASSTP
jgi:hypothetical protein